MHTNIIPMFITCYVYLGTYVANTTFKQHYASLLPRYIYNAKDTFLGFEKK